MPSHCQWFLHIQLSSVVNHGVVIFAHAPNHFSLSSLPIDGFRESSKYRRQTHPCVVRPLLLALMLLVLLLPLLFLLHSPPNFYD
jgi:hypothetical protein